MRQGGQKRAISAVTRVFDALWRAVPTRGVEVYVESDVGFAALSPPYGLRRLQQYVLLLAERELDHAFRRQVL
jgi:hypothetical protein